MTRINISVVLASLLSLPLAALAQEDVANDAADLEEVSVDPAEQTVPVADEEVLTGPDATAADDAEVTTEEQLMTEFARYRRLVSEGILDEADIAAKRIVEMAIKVYGPQSRETANALNNLGIVQHGNGQYEAAIQNFTSAVEIIEAVEDRLNAALVNPLKGLGAAQLANGRPDQARNTYVRAAHITEVNEGPHNLGQVEILEAMAEAYVRMSDVKQARQILDRIHIINVKHFDENPMGLLPSLMNRADWQHRAGYYSEERTTYRRAIRIIEASRGKNDPLLIEPLQRLGKTFFFIDRSVSSTQNQYSLITTAETYFKRAARIADKAKDIDWRTRVDAKLELADYYTYVEIQNRSKKLYREIWGLLSEGEERIALREELFSNPVAIKLEELPTYIKGTLERPNRSDLIEGHVAVDFSVSTRGRVREIQTTVTPTEFTAMRDLVHREIRNTIFRPRIVDGLAVRANDVHFEHKFSYLKADLEEVRVTPQPEQDESEPDETEQDSESD